MEKYLGFEESRRLFYTGLWDNKTYESCDMCYLYIYSTNKAQLVSYEEIVQDKYEFLIYSWYFAPRLDDMLEAIDKRAESLGNMCANLEEIARTGKFQCGLTLITLPDKLLKDIYRNGDTRLEAAYNCLMAVINIGEFKISEMYQTHVEV
jgi:hypothetical protein